MATLKLENINKIYDNNVQAVFDFNLEIEDNEFIVFVGPSGCGKSTTIRMIAGLEEITSGNLYIDEKLVNNVEPKDRDIAMVFQSYALYPHMSVFDNMSFALKLQKMDKEEIKKRVNHAAEILGLTEYLNRKPKALSGGQRQRVALGRAIVRNPKVFLMDEPLSNLDAKLRVQMRSEIIKLHERVDATTVYVTHDQTEAMTMATRIVVMKDGYIQQIGTPKEIYSNPANIFVAGFIGAPATNFLTGTYEDKHFTFGDHKIEVLDSMVKDLEPYNGKEVIMGVRPEDIYCDNIVADTYPSTQFDFHVDISELLGHESILHGLINGESVIAKVATRLGIKAHSDIKISFDLSKIHFYDAETTNRIV
ncbi:carbohydrate ABC transporter ATP-binding protein (CUT1 family) [Breznakia blatticola]|uniref:Carbohydrate ABC transporter ATP-binding protein (CUT1 family) n=1 Tax=Breznakia blatticola TaxID=1754012 RepID=A0A4R8A422_9FIRM|nr:sn-glycerol-3-phosphate ABC transporter ATP-binding protein UgpC [Breznakia blatticola]TDW25333.1 carbohydrate ABC transporter ATP-binding protein (CUT1 family) [Breznakia blatticola]